ncbi:MAG: T9SS type A sorting domain-containing protein [Alphaproteobacteria bacterium]|nr:T9SS type A sorting domain-containing protein [Alphaproteobacteria bacterium]
MGVSLYRTENGGSSWIDISNSGIHVDHHAMFFTGTSILEGNDGGFYRSTNNGNIWNKINNLPLTQFYAIDIDYLTPERIYGGTQDNNTIRTWNGGINTWEPILGGDGMYCLVDYTNSDRIYCEYQYGNLFRSDDGGYNMNYISGPMSGDRVNWSAPLAMDPQSSSTLYFGTYRVWKTTNYGDSWQSVSDDLTHGIDHYFYTLTTIDVSPVNPSIVIAGSGDGLVHVSTNGGLTWQNISAGLPERWVTRVKADPFDAQTIYVTLSGFRWDEPLPHVFKSINLGQTWTNISGNLPELPVNDIALDPDFPGKVIVGTDAGLYGSINDGQSWSWIWDGLPAVAICALKIHEPTRTIVAGTYGLSSYKANLDDILTGISPAVNSKKIALSAFPNPVQNQTRLRFYLPAECTVSITLTGMNGTPVQTIFQGNLPKGKQDIPVVIGNENHTIPPGVYILKVDGGSFTGSIKIVKV